MEDSSNSIILSAMEFVAGIFLAALLAFASAEIVSRYFFDYPLIWVTELCRFILLWLVFLGATVLTKKSAHLMVGVSLDKYLSNKKQTIALKVLVNSCISAVLILTAVYGGKAVLMTSKMVGPATRVPMYFVWAAIPINGGLMLYFIIEETVSLFRMEG
jgi:TRAP-type C4-dicarboxylate transport system permease small subunit